jgi:hypothetical protein
MTLGVFRDTTASAMKAFARNLPDVDAENFFERLYSPEERAEIEAQIAAKAWLDEHPPYHWLGAHAEDLWTLWPFEAA